MPHEAIAVPTDADAALVAAKEAEIAQLRALARSGALSATVATAGLETAERELQTFKSASMKATDADAARVVRMLRRVADAMRKRITGGSLGLRTPAGIAAAQATLFDFFGGKVKLRRGEAGPQEKPFLIARTQLNRLVVLKAAANAAACVELGSGGRI